MMSGEAVSFEKKQDTLDHELKQFIDFIKQNKDEVPDALKRAAKIFYNKIIHGIQNVRVNDFSEDKQFYITMLQEANDILGNLNNPVSLADKMDKLHGKTKRYLNQYLDNDLKCNQYLGIFCSIMTVLYIAFTIASVTALTGICPFLTLMYAQTVFKASGALLAGILGTGIFYAGISFFNNRQKNIQSKINTNNQDILTVPRRAVV